MPTPLTAWTMNRASAAVWPLGTVIVPVQCVESVGSFVKYTEFQWLSKPVEVTQTSCMPADGSPTTWVSTVIVFGEVCAEWMSWIDGGPARPGWTVPLPAGRVAVLLL